MCVQLACIAPAIAGRSPTERSSEQNTLLLPSLCRPCDVRSLSASSQEQIGAERNKKKKKTRAKESPCGKRLCACVHVHRWWWYLPRSRPVRVTRWSVLRRIGAFVQEEEEDRAGRRWVRGHGRVGSPLRPPAPPGPTASVHAGGLEGN